MWNEVSLGVSISPGQAGWGNAWATHSLDVHSNTLLDQGCAWVRPLFRIDSQGVFQVQCIELRDVTGEYNAFGHADAASRSASSASASESNAVQSASAASGSENRAATSEGSAKTYRDEAARSEQNASGSASTASQQAGLAAGSASGASGSASAAAGSASTAATRADEAGRSATAASSSEVAASSAATGADQVFAITFPSFVGPVGRKAYAYLGDDATGFNWENGPSTGWPQSYITAQNGGQGGTNNRIGFKESVNKQVGRRYRVSGWFYNHGSNCQNVSIWLLNTDNNLWDNSAVGRGGDVVAPGCVNGTALNQGGFWKVGIEFVVTDEWKPKWKPIFEFITTGGAPNNLWHMTGITIEDITSEAAAAGSAAAASTSYSNANIRAGEAAGSASAASGHANTASQQAGAAAGSASAAAGSASQASGSASAAASSASLAATFSTGGGNLLQESSFEVGYGDWGVSIASGVSGFQWDRDLSGDAWRPTNEHNLGILQSDGDNSRASQWNTQQIAVTGNTWYEFSGYVAAHRCRAYVRVDWYDGSNNGISSSWGVVNEGYGNGGPNIGSWTRSWGKVQSPANAARAYFCLIKEGTLPGNSDSYAWICRPMLRETYEQANGPSPYAPANSRSTIAAQKASIDQNATAIATASSSLASLETVVRSGNPNLLRNGGFAQSMDYWAQTHSGWFTIVSGGWGLVAQRNGDWSGDHCYLDSERVPVFGGAVYTLSADSVYYLNSGSGTCYTEIVWWDGAGNYITQNSGTANLANHDFSTNGSNRVTHKLTITAPGNATAATARVVHWRSAGSSVNVIGWRQIKFEQGDVMTAYSNEASVQTISETITNVDGKANTALARAGVRLDVNGYVTGWETNNNGSYGNMVINADNFAIQKPGGGARTEYSNGCWKVFDQNGQLRVRLGNLSA